MKMKLNIFARSAFLFAILGCVSTGFAQNGKIAGGYAKVSVNDKSVIKAARFAVRERAKTQNTEVNLVEIKNAKLQIAAGRNYEICLLTNYLNKRSDKLVDQFVRIVVYQDLKNKLKLTSWTQEHCLEEQKSR
jgi:hypothetical protein